MFLTIITCTPSFLSWCFCEIMIHVIITNIIQYTFLSLRLVRPRTSLTLWRVTTSATCSLKPHYRKLPPDFLCKSHAFCSATSVNHVEMHHHHFFPQIAIRYLLIFWSCLSVPPMCWIIFGQSTSIFFSFWQYRFTLREESFVWTVEPIITTELSIIIIIIICIQ